MVQPGVAFIILFIFVETCTALVNNSDIEALINRTETTSEPQDTPLPDGRRKDKKYTSTSSSSGHEKGKESSGRSNEESLDLSSSGTSSSSVEKKNKKYVPKSSVERTGWRKWHRKCYPCPNDMRKKWRDPTISWICGGYQRARRSFKSHCMMHYRNCQDGTMFVKIHDHRCDNGSNIKPHGDHFFYEYHVDLTDESSSSSKSDSESTDSMMDESSY